VDRAVGKVIAGLFYSTDRTTRFSLYRNMIPPMRPLSHLLPSDLISSHSVRGYHLPDHNKKGAERLDRRG